MILMPIKTTMLRAVVRCPASLGPYSQHWLKAGMRRGLLRQDDEGRFTQLFEYEVSGSGV